MFKCMAIVTTFSLTYRGRAIDARLHTAVSVGLVYSIISVHKLEDLIVPRFCWLLFLLQESCDNRQKNGFKKEFNVSNKTKIRQTILKSPYTTYMGSQFLSETSRSQTRDFVLAQPSSPYPELTKWNHLRSCIHMLARIT